MTFRHIRNENSQNVKLTTLPPHESARYDGSKNHSNLILRLLLLAPSRTVAYSFHIGRAHYVSHCYAIVRVAITARGLAAWQWPSV
jgi:hypothetical protein